MSPNVVIKQGPLVWSGEHWINYLREPGTEPSTGRVSLFHTRYCSAGEGNVAFVTIPGPGGLDAVCADNPDLARFTVETFTRGRGGPFDRELPTVSARFTRAGDVRVAPSWTIETDQHVVVATWSQLQPPLLAEGTFRAGHEHFTILLFAERATIQFDGRHLPGEPYRVDTWRASIGGDRSSCVFALAETLMQLPKPS
jgi:hypothetical protein